MHKYASGEAVQMKGIRGKSSSSVGGIFNRKALSPRSEYLIVKLFLRGWNI